MTAGTITIIRGEDFTLNFAVQNSDGSAYNLTGCSVTLMVRKKAGQEPVIDKTTTHTNAVGGFTALTLSGVETELDVRAWRYQVILVDVHGNDKPSGVHTFLVTDMGTTTNSLGITIGADSATVGVQITEPETPAGDLHYEQVFLPSSFVAVTHNLNKRPAVTVIDSAGDEVEGYVHHVSPNQLTLTFSAAFSGTVFCN